MIFNSFKKIDGDDMEFESMNKELVKELHVVKDDMATSKKVMDTTRQNAETLLSKLLKPRDNLTASKGAWLSVDTELNIDDFWLCQIDEITFVDKAPQKEGVENILGTFRGLKGFNFIYMILGDVEKCRFYFGVVKDNVYNKDDKFSVQEIGENLLKAAIQGNFRGCKCRTVENDQKKYDMLNKQEIFAKLHDNKFFVGMLDGVPSPDTQKNRLQNTKESFQGIDRLIDVMQGNEFGVVIIARPCGSNEVNSLNQQLYKASDMLSPLTKHSLQYTTNMNHSYNDNASLGLNKQNSDSAQENNSDNFTHSEGTATDIRREVSKQLSKSNSDSYTDQFSHSKSYNYSHDIGGGGKDREDAHETADNNSRSTQKSLGNGYNFNTNEISSTSQSENHQYTEVHGESKIKSESISQNEQLSKAEAANTNISRIENLETTSKAATEWLKYIDEVLLPRIDNGKGKGIFNVCTYLMAESEIAYKRLTNTIVSLYSGSAGNKTELRGSLLEEKDYGCLKLLRNLQMPAKLVGHSHSPYETLISRLAGKKNNEEIEFCGSWMSANELGLLTGFPQREIIGLKLREEVEFGLNSTYVEPQNRIVLGQMVQCGRKINVPISLDKNELDKHMFIAGVTGSGKTTTCQNILIDSDIPFLVIEPAKTEYRALNNHEELRDKEIIYFTLGKQKVAPFFLNPFELFRGEEISSRADMLKATFEASFEMEAAIPQIMGTAIYTAYQDKGWNTSTTTWKNKTQGGSDDPFSDGVYAFPTLSDFKIAIKKVIEKQGFDDRLREEYLGSINARIESLMIGAKGQMLNTPRSIDFMDLVERRVVIELEEVKSGSEKSLIMGLIMTNLLQAVKLKYREYKHSGKNFRHITLIEEAHRLLSRYMPGDNRNQKQGVEVFADMLAEVRKYGESLIIVDQIPDKMTPEVLKNTNTKIVHKLFAKDDKDAIGNTMGLSDEQKNFLSNLTPGRAIVFSGGWEKALQVQVDMKSNTGSNDIEEEEIHKRSLKYYSLPTVARRGVVLGLPNIPSEKLSPEIADKMLWLKMQSYHWLNELKESILAVLLQKSNEKMEDTISFNRRHREIIDGIVEADKKIGRDEVVQYIYQSLKDIIYDDEIFISKTKTLLEKFTDLDETDKGIDNLKIYISAMQREDICILK